jgi:prophage tail gpP-like protein
MIRFYFVLPVVCILLTGCAGYRLGNISGRNLQGVHTIFVPMVHNDTYTANFETACTDAIIRRFNNDGTLLTTNSANADAEVDVTLMSIATNPLRTTISDTLVTAQYQLTVKAEVTVTNRRTGTMLLDKLVLTGSTTFYLQTDVIEGERQALPLACEDLAKNIVTSVTEGW